MSSFNATDASAFFIEEYKRSCALKDPLMKRVLERVKKETNMDTKNLVLINCIELSDDSKDVSKYKCIKPSTFIKLLKANVIEYKLNPCNAPHNIEDSRLILGDPHTVTNPVIPMVSNLIYDLKINDSRLERYKFAFLLYKDYTDITVCSPEIVVRLDYDNLIRKFIGMGTLRSGHWGYDYDYMRSNYILFDDWENSDYFYVWTHILERRLKEVKRNFPIENFVLFNDHNELFIKIIQYTLFYYENWVEPILLNGFSYDECNCDDLICKHDNLLKIAKKSPYFGIAILDAGLYEETVEEPDSPLKVMNLLRMDKFQLPEDFVERINDWLMQLK